MEKVSIVIPVYNEQENIEILINEIMNISVIDFISEIIIVNDHSSDNSINIILKLQSIFNKIKLINHEHNCGQSKSIHTGISHATTNTIITLDGDLQNNPSDIQELMKIYFSDINIKLVSGIRIKRKDSLSKILSSKIANFIRSRYLSDNCKDTGCSLKVFDKDIFLSFPYFDGIHRFLPALFNGYGYKTKYVTVNHRKRKFGVSKYDNLKRLYRGVADMVRVNKIIKNKKDI